MLSSSEAFARPVRSDVKSLRKSSTAFSMRVFAAAIASLVVAIVVISILSSQLSVISFQQEIFDHEDPSANRSQPSRSVALYVSFLTENCQLIAKSFFTPV